MAEPEMSKVEEVAKNLYAVIGSGDTPHSGYGANQFFGVSGDGVVVIDTGFNKPIAERLKKFIRSKTDEEIRAVINTHHHSDHFFGNSVLVEEGRTATFCHDYCRMKIADEGRNLISGYAKSDRRLARDLKGLQVVVPKVKYDRKITVIVGDLEFELIHPPKGAHTMGDTYAYFGDEKVLVGGDVLWNGYYPNCEDASLSGWVETLRRIRGGPYKASIHIPGHGQIYGSRRELDVFQNYMENVTNDLRRMRRMKVDEIRSVFLEHGSDDWKLKYICDYNAKMLSARQRKGKR
jgi:cyclase